MLMHDAMTYSGCQLQGGEYGYVLYLYLDVDNFCSCQTKVSIAYMDVVDGYVKP